jgi:hypothetical protein
MIFEDKNMSEIGKKYNNWTIIGDAPDRIDASGKYHKRYLCECKCGNRLVKDFYKLKSGAKMCKECYLKILPDNGIPFDKGENKYDLSGEYGIGWSNNSEQPFYFDLDDYDKIKDYYWYLEKSGYIRARQRNSKTSIGMHQLLCGIGCDHINRKRYDNRKENLRMCSQQDNTQNRSVGKNNTSGVIGVVYIKRSNRWTAYLNYHKKRINLGSYENKEDAIVARLNAEVEYCKEFAPQKHLFEQYGITQHND